MSELEENIAMKKCPYCAEEIREDSSVCEHCGRNLVDSSTSVQNRKPAKKRKSNATKIILILILLIITIWIYTQVGFYTVQPIGSLPEGVTLIVFRAGEEPFFNSPDAMCLLIQNSVSLLCRGAALAKAPVDRIILRLPYMKWAYLASTGGREFER